MNLLKIFLYFMMLVLSNQLLCQESYTTLGIPSELKEYANAVVRDNSTEVTIHDYNSITINTTYVVTVFNKLGDEEILNYQLYNSSERIKKIEAVVYDAFGKEIKNFRKKDFTDVSAVDRFSIYSDDRVMYVSYTPVSYPYTFEFKVEVASSLTAFIPRWNPIPSFHVSVEKSNFQIHNPKQLKFDYKTYNFENYGIKPPLITDTEIKLEAHHIPAVVYEYYHPGFQNIKPRFVFTLKKFQLVNSTAEVNSWDDFGRWQSQSLLSGRDVLPQKTIQEVTFLVSDTQDTIEKVRRIYEYMQKKTRYISVQIGLGGWQPSSAEEVDRLSYGDCKGLTNYTKALLQSQGIPSYYTIVYGDEFIQDIDPDLVAMQGNHVILTVPIGGEYYFLECTSQTVPFNYIAGFTDNRNVMIVTPNGGEIIKTRKYLPEENFTNTRATVQLMSDGSAVIDLSVNTHGASYRNLLGLDKATEKEIHDFYRKSWGYLHNLKFENIEHENNKVQIVYQQKLKMQTTNYGIFNGNDFIFSPNMFNRYENIPVRYTQRKLPVRIMRGLKNRDIIDYKIPEGYQLSYLPENVSFETPFGKYEASYSQDTSGNIVYQRELLINDGVFQPEEYESLRNFFREVVKNDQNKIVLTQNK